MVQKVPCHVIWASKKKNIIKWNKVNSKLQTIDWILKRYLQEEALELFSTWVRNDGGVYNFSNGQHFLWIWISECKRSLRMEVKGEKGKQEGIGLIKSN